MSKLRLREVTQKTLAFPCRALTTHDTASQTPRPGTLQVPATTFLSKNMCTSPNLSAKHMRCSLALLLSSLTLAL